jgi:hypothetical protein
MQSKCCKAAIFVPQSDHGSDANYYHCCNCLRACDTVNFYNLGKGELNE